MPEYGNTGAQTVSTPLLSGGTVIGKRRSGRAGSAAPRYRPADIDSSVLSDRSIGCGRLAGYNPMPNNRIEQKQTTIR